MKGPVNFPIIDSAVRFRSGGGAFKVMEWLKEAKTWGIVHSVAAPPDEFVAVYNERGNELMAGVVKRYPRRFSGLAVANPWYGKKAVTLLRKAFDAGLSGLYLHPGRQGFHLTESIVNPLIQVCRDYAKPVYSYTGTPVCCMPFQLAELARRFPQVSFVLGHFAWSDFCGYDVIPACKQAPNIYIETSCATGGMVRAALDALGPERILFGSGYPRSLPEHEFEKIRPLKLPDDVLRRYFTENAKRLWQVPL